MLLAESQDYTHLFILEEVKAPFNLSRINLKGKTVKTEYQD